MKLYTETLQEKVDCREENLTAKINEIQVRI